MNFADFREAMASAIADLQQFPLVRTDVSKAELWETYLASFPEGTNPIYRERTVHDCQCCKQFIRVIGNVVALVEDKKVSVWGAAAERLEAHTPYWEVAVSMAALVQPREIVRPFYHYQSKVGQHHNFSDTHGEVERYDHFYVELPGELVKLKSDIDTIISKEVSTLQVFQRALETISMDAIETVLELIDQNSLYRGDEYRQRIKTFGIHKLSYDRDMLTPENKAVYCWQRAPKLHESVTRIRNSAIGTLLVDLSEGRELDAAVSAFEAMVAPTNYKRPKALITKSMIKRAQQKVEELGFGDSLQRRHAMPEDITVNNVLYANRDARRAMGEDVFDELMEEQPVDVKSLSRVEEIDIEDFIANVLPHAEQVELLTENRLIGNLMSLLAPINADAPNMLKWENNFSWSYNGELADSMKQRVKAMGGDVDGVIRFSIQWNDGDDNQCDYDAHCIEPNGNRIYYGHKTNPHSSGKLDVDIIHPERRVAVENITWSDRHKMQDGRYQFRVHCYSARRNNNGFTAEFEYDGEIRSYAHNREIRHGQFVDVIEGMFSKQSGFTVTKEMPTSVHSRTEWNLQTMQYHPVTMMMLSPNHWDGKAIGNKHYFFILNGCRQDGKVRGFYNEFLTDKLHDHRKVFEVLGSKMKAEEADTQLSGLGFSSTQRNHVYCRVSGSFTRTLKITF